MPGLAGYSLWSKVPCSYLSLLSSAGGFRPYKHDLERYWALLLKDLLTFIWIYEMRPKLCTSEGTDNENIMIVPVTCVAYPIFNCFGYCCKMLFHRGTNSACPLSAFLLCAGFMPLKCGYFSNVNFNVNNLNGKLCIKDTIKDTVSQWWCH